MKNLMIGIFALSKEEQYKLEPQIIKSNNALTIYSYAKNIKKGKDIKTLEDKFLSLEDNSFIYNWGYDIPEADLYKCINLLYERKEKEDYIDTLVETYLLTGDQTIRTK